MRLIGLCAAASLLAILGCSNISTPEAIAVVAGADQCAKVDAAMLGAVVASGKWVAADAEAGMPAFCEVSATLSPAEGSSIGVVYRLPETWNGRVLGLGGGGWAGNLTLFAAGEGLQAGYATAQTDGGHPGTDVWDNSWMAEPVKIEDFASRTIHEMTVAAKALVATYYGMSPDRAYFQGCSTGGRMAMMEAQRFPEDYDAISAGAPVYTLQVQTSAIMRSNLFQKPGAAFTAEQLGLVNSAVMKACDAKDGLEDGVINNPAACYWDPGELICKPGAARGSCISAVQADVLRTAYSGIRDPNGEWAMLPLAKGGEPGWSPFIASDGAKLAGINTGGIITMGEPLFGDAGFDFAQFKPSDAAKARSSTFAKAYEAKDPDLSRFIARGGKLLLWHGMNDQAPNYLATADYLEKAEALNSSTGDHVRFFTLPGVPHCRGGPGASDIDLLAALDQWVDSGKAPDSLAAKGADDMVRKACAWPKVAQYKGSGDGNDLDGWECVNPAG